MTAFVPLRILIVDDEPLARRRLRQLAHRHPLTHVGGEAASGAEALQHLESGDYQLAFLDVQMPGLSGLDVLKSMEEGPSVVLTTAHDRYAVAAFDHGVVDYLLKPFSSGRFSAAVERVKVTRDRSEQDPPPVLIKERGRLVPVPISQILRVEADGDYVRIMTRSRTHLLTATLKDLHRHGGFRHFLRIHRSHLVNPNFLEALERSPGGRLSARLTDGSAVPASRRRYRELLQHLTP